MSMAPRNAIAEAELAVMTICTANMKAINDVRRANKQNTLTLRYDGSGYNIIELTPEVEDRIRYIGSPMSLENLAGFLTGLLYGVKAEAIPSREVTAGAILDPHVDRLVDVLMDDLNTSVPSQVNGVDAHAYVLKKVVEKLQSVV